MGKFIIPTNEQFILDVKIGRIRTPKQHDPKLYKAYITWKDLRKRLTSENCQSKRPTYVGTMIDVEWLRFSNFKKWFDVNYVEGYELDKDLKFPGSKVYGPEFCLFVPGELNRLFNDRSKCRGDYPLGVNLHQGRCYAARCHQPWKTSQHIGYFPSPLEAHRAWLATKIQVIRYHQGKYESYHKIVEALEKWANIFQSHLDAGTEYLRDDCQIGKNLEEVL